MGSRTHIIELNGKRYDALTGKAMADIAPASPTVHHTPKVTTPRSMDGLSHGPRAKDPPSQQHRPVQKSQTLMRKTVQKPAPHKVHAITSIVKSAQHVAPETSSPKKSSSRPNVKSKLIHKFSPNNSMPTPATPSHQTTQPTSTPALSQAAVNAAAVVVRPLDRAIANATSHQQPKLKRPALQKRWATKLHISPKLISGGALVVAFLLLAGFFGYQNVPNLKMRIAASRAGVPATLPAYHPPGFSLANISYKTGQIDIGFKSNSDNRNFQLTQVASAWNTDTLRDKLRSNPQIANPVEVPDKGTTLFIYNNSNATWVDGGIWYKLEGDSKLNSDQLLRLANSL